MRPNPEQQHEMDAEMTRRPFRVGDPPRAQKTYTWNSPDFHYSLRCILCRHETEHSHEQHMILAAGI